MAYDPHPASKFRPRFGMRVARGPNDRLGPKTFSGIVLPCQTPWQNPSS
jgi:hypothetical protein